MKTLLGSVHFKQITYKMKILEINGVIPTEFQDDFIEWLKSKASELGTGTHSDYYSDHDETGKTDINVLFSVHLFN